MKISYDINDKGSPHFRKKPNAVNINRKEVNEGSFLNFTMRNYRLVIFVWEKCSYHESDFKEI